MDKIIRKHVKKGKKWGYYHQEYFIYDKAEADKLGIEYKGWKNCAKGDFGLSDDGYVSVCLKRGVTKRSDYIVFPFGSQFASKHGKLEYLKHKETGNFSCVSPKPWWEQKKNTGRYKRFAKAYVKMFLGGSVDYGLLGQIYSKNEKNPVATARTLLKKKYIKEIVDQELDKELAEYGITHQTVYDLFMKAADLAEKKGDPGNITRVAENLKEIMGIGAKYQKPNNMEIDALYGTEIDDISELIGSEDRKELKNGKIPQKKAENTKTEKTKDEQVNEEVDKGIFA